MVFGYLTTFDMNHADYHAISTMTKVGDFYYDLLEQIGMKNHKFVIDKYGNLDSVYGITFVSMIDCSSITGHFVEDKINPRLYIDVFSCKLYDKNLVQEVIYEHFGTTRSKFKIEEIIRR